MELKYQSIFYHFYVRQFRFDFICFRNQKSVKSTSIEINNMTSARVFIQKKNEYIIIYVVPSQVLPRFMCISVHLFVELLHIGSHENSTHRSRYLLGKIRSFSHVKILDPSFFGSRYLGSGPGPKKLRKFFGFQRISHADTRNQISTLTTAFDSQEIFSLDYLTFIDF